MRCSRRYLNHEIREYNTQSNRSKVLCDSVCDVFDIAGLAWIQFFEVAVDDLRNICTVSHGNRKERVPEHHIEFLDLVAVQVVQNQLKCEEDDTKDDCPDKEFGFPTKSVWLFHNYRN